MDTRNGAWEYSLEVAIASFEPFWRLPLKRRSFRICKQKTTKRLNKTLAKRVIKWRTSGLYIVSYPAWLWCVFVHKTRFVWCIDKIYVGMHTRRHIIYKHARVIISVFPKTLFYFTVVSHQEVFLDQSKCYTLSSYLSSSSELSALRWGDENTNS